MDSYYCIVGTDAEPVAELCVLDARDDLTARARALEVADTVAGWARVSVHAGERVVSRIERAVAPTALPLAA